MANKRELIRLHKRLCKELGIRPAKVVINTNMPDEWAGFYNTRDVRIEINPNASVNLPMTMAHETYHHYQRVMGWLCRQALYKGVDDNHRPWYRQPCERAANRYMHKIASREGWYETKNKQTA